MWEHFPSPWLMSAMPAECFWSDSTFLCELPALCNLQLMNTPAIGAPVRLTASGPSSFRVEADIQNSWS